MAVGAMGLLIHRGMVTLDATQVGFANTPGGLCQLEIRFNVGLLSAYTDERYSHSTGSFVSRILMMYHLKTL